jgi:hypothetical protein
MKRASLAAVAFFAVAVTLILTLSPALGESTSPAPTRAMQLSLPLFLVPVELGAAEFQGGDGITIEQVLCTSERLGTNEICIVKGTYTLASQDQAVLALHVTSKGPSGPTPIDARQQTVVKKGAGAFELRHVLSDGYPHVSFYPATGNGGGDLGGVYFGRGESLLKSKGWKSQRTGR